MSAAETPEDVAASESAALPDQMTSAKKSYRRKYRKIMVNFEEKMREGTSLFKDEQRIFDISLRLAEQTDQILELLLEMNSLPQIPQRLRYELQPQNVEMDTKMDFKTYDEEEGYLALRKARSKLQTGEITARGYQDLEQDIVQSSTFAPKQSYANLVRDSHIPVGDSGWSDTAHQSVGSVGFLSSKQEEDYMQGLDSYIAGTSSTSRPHVTTSLGNKNAEKSTEREREMQLKNPVSVYNWLRKHQPQVFLQDNETATEKVSKPSGSRSSKRNTIHRDSLIKQEEMYDDEGIAVEVSSTSRGKRKRDDDGGYRPKGGNSRASKRKKDESSSAAKRGKKMSIDAKS